MYGLTRGMMTLVGAAVAGALLWFATQLEVDTTSEYWASIGLVASAGLAMAVSQLLGGWTKWGWPRLSASVFLLGFLPALVVGGLVILHAQPESGAFGIGWAGDLGLDDVAEDLTTVLPAIAFGLGLLFGLMFDTTGPGVREITVEEQEERARRGYVGPIPIETVDADEPIGAERGATSRYPVDRNRDGTEDHDEPYVASEPGPTGTYPVVDRDREGVDDRDETASGEPIRRDER
jgi:hypothetical protein